MFPLEVLQDLLKPVTLALRLFGNIFAGGIMLALIAGMVSLAPANIPVGSVLTIVFSVIWKLFDTIFLGGLQAFIFALLTVLYFGMAGAHGEDDHDEAHDQKKDKPQNTVEQRTEQKADADHAPAEPEPAR
jgi:F-type H+-transporting ATPase subunit a